MADRKRPKVERLFPDAGSARDGFRQANPEQFGRAAGDLDTVRRLASVEARAASIKDRLRAHIARNEKLWIANEAGKLLQNRAAAPAPPVKVNPKQVADGLTRDAQRIVRARATRRMTALNATKARMQNAIVRSTPQSPKTPEQDNRQRLTETFRRVNGPKMN